MQELSTLFVKPISFVDEIDKKREMDLNIFDEYKIERQPTQNAKLLSIQILRNVKYRILNIERKTNYLLTNT